MKKSSLYTILGASFALVALACGSGGDDEASSGGDAGSTSGGGDKPAAAVATIGKPAKDGKFEFTVTKFECGKDRVGNSTLGQEAQGQFCLMTVKVKNIGKEAQLLDASSQKAKDAKGTTYDADGGAAIYVNKQADVFLNNINPGNTVTGVVPFDVPKDTKVTTVELHDSPFSGGVTVKVG